MYIYILHGYRKWLYKITYPIDNRRMRQVTVFARSLGFRLSPSASIIWAPPRLGKSPDTKIPKSNEHVGTRFKMHGKMMANDGKASKIMPNVGKIVKNHGKCWGFMSFTHHIWVILYRVIYGVIIWGHPSCGVIICPFAAPPRPRARCPRSDLCVASGQDQWSFCQMEMTIPSP